MTVIVDYGLGNKGAIINMLSRLGYQAIVSSRYVDIEAASRIILPGVGSFDSGMQKLNASGLVEPIKAAVANKTPLLGICLGAQMLLNTSEEGQEMGLGLIPGKSVRFRNNYIPPVRVPHMGWNEIVVSNPHRLFVGLEHHARFYFVHSYRLVPEYTDNVIASSNHGETFAAAIALGNVMGVQFHPEKSHKFGMTLLSNFITRF